MKNYAYVREKSIPPSSPPLIEVGVIGWIRQNLFSSWFNSFLTLFSLYFIFICLVDFIPWAWGGHWNAKSLRECMDLDPNVACFSVLAARWEQLLFGLYPADQYWRPTLTFVFLILSIIPILFPRFFRYFWFSVIYPGLAIWLLWGGSIWSIAIIYIGVLLGVASFTVLSKGVIRSTSVNLTLSIVITLLFFLFLS